MCIHQHISISLQKPNIEACYHSRVAARDKAICMDPLWAFFSGGRNSLKSHEILLHKMWSDTGLPPYKLIRVYWRGVEGGLGVGGVYLNCHRKEGGNSLAYFNYCLAAPVNKWASGWSWDLTEDWSRGMGSLWPLHLDQGSTWAWLLQREERLLVYLGLMSTQGMGDGSRPEPGSLNSAGH